MKYDYMCRHEEVISKQAKKTKDKGSDKLTPHSSVVIETLTFAL